MGKNVDYYLIHSTLAGFNFGVIVSRGVNIFSLIALLIASTMIVYYLYQGIGEVDSVS